jgi:cell division protein FtsN
MKMKEMIKNLIAKVKENKIKSGIITGLLVMTLVGGTATAMLMSDNTSKADNSKTTTVAKTVKKDDVKKSNSKKVEKEIKENKESKPEEVKEAEKKLEEAKKSGNIEAIKEAEKLVETKKSTVKATASSNSTSKQTASTSKQTVSNSSTNSSKSSSEATKPAAPQKKKVWVVTKPAWDEQVPDYNLPIYKSVEVARFYNGAGQLIYTIVDNSENVKAKYKELANVNGLSLEIGNEDVPTGEYQTKTIHHEAEGEYVWQ